jgi:hypothetical protein
MMNFLMLNADKIASGGDALFLLSAIVGGFLAVFVVIRNLAALVNLRNKIFKEKSA